MPLPKIKLSPGRASVLSSILAGALVFVQQVPARADSISVQPAADATLIEFAPDNNMEAVTFFNAGTTAVGTRNRGLMFFDLGTLIPVGAIITSVELHLDVVAQPSSMQPFTLSFSYLPVQNTNALTLTAWPTGGTGVATGLVVLPTLPLALPVPSLAIAATYLKLTNMTATFNDLGGLAWLPRHPQPAAIARGARTIFPEPLHHAVSEDGGLFLEQLSLRRVHQRRRRRYFLGIKIVTL